MTYVRRAKYVALALTLSVAAAACGGGSDGGDSGGVIKIGQVLPVNSVQAALAKIETAGAEIAVDEINSDGGVAGKKLKMVVKDDKLEPARVGTVLRELNDEDVKLTMGFQTSPECQAGAEAAVRLDQVVLANHCSSDLLVNPKPASDNFWMLSASGNEIADAAGQFLAKSKPEVSTWDVFGYDADIMKSNWERVKASAGKDGDPITQNQGFWVPVDATSYRSQITKQVSGLAATQETRGLFLSMYGAGTTNYMKQAEPLGLLGKYSTVMTLGAYWSSALAMNGTSPNIYDVHEYFAGCQDSPLDKSFVAAYQKKMGTLPDAGAYQAYVGVKFYAAAIEKAGSADPKKVQKAFAGLSIDTPAGKLTMDGDRHKAVNPISVANLVGDSTAPDGIKIVSCESVQG